MSLIRNTIQTSGALETSRRRGRGWPRLAIQFQVIVCITKLIQEPDGRTERCSNRRHREQGFDISHLFKLDPFRSGRLDIQPRGRKHKNPCLRQSSGGGPDGSRPSMYVLHISASSVTSCDCGDCTECVVEEHNWRRGLDRRPPRISLHGVPRRSGPVYRAPGWDSWAPRMLARQNAVSNRWQRMGGSDCGRFIAISRFHGSTLPSARCLQGEHLELRCVPLGLDEYALARIEVTLQRADRLPGGGRDVCESGLLVTASVSTSATVSSTVTRQTLPARRLRRSRA